MPNRDYKLSKEQRKRKAEKDREWRASKKQVKEKTEASPGQPKTAKVTKLKVTVEQVVEEAKARNKESHGLGSDWKVSFEELRKFYHLRQEDALDAFVRIYGHAPDIDGRA